MCTVAEKVYGISLESSSSSTTIDDDDDDDDGANKCEIQHVLVHYD